LPASAASEPSASSPWDGRRSKNLAPRRHRSRASTDGIYVEVEAYRTRVLVMGVVVGGLGVFMLAQGFRTLAAVALGRHCPCGLVSAVIALGVGGFATGMAIQCLELAGRVRRTGELPAQIRASFENPAPRWMRVTILGLIAAELAVFVLVFTGTVSAALFLLLFPLCGTFIVIGRRYRRSLSPGSTARPRPDHAEVS
jgi:hypothetical protein